MTKSEPERDPIADYEEWADNRYNPGHWLGGNIPPSIRNLGGSSSKGRRLAGVVMVGSALVGMAFGFLSLDSPNADVIVTVTLLVGVPAITIGVMIFFDLPRAASKRARRP